MSEVTALVIEAAYEKILSGLQECSAKHHLTIENLTELDCLWEITENALEAACDVMLENRYL